MKKRKSVVNIVISLFSQAIILILGLIVPRIIMLNYGSDTNGLTSTITQIFTYVALLEAGISEAARNVLYKPVKENDQDGVSKIVSTAKKYYRRVAYIYFAVVLILSFTLPLVLKSELDYWTIVIYVFFEGLSSIIAFYFIEIWRCLLTVEGKQYIVNIISLLTRLLNQGIKIILALLGVNIALVQVGFFVVSLVQLAIYYIYMKRKYSWIKYDAFDKDYKLPNKGSYVLINIAWTIFSSTDMIILSIFVSTSLASVYSVYNMVFLAVTTFVNSLFTALNYHLGHAYVSSIDDYKKVHDIFNSLFVGIICALMAVTYILIIPFIKLYTSGVEDINYIYLALPVLFCAVQILSWSRYISGNLMGIAGYAKEASVVSIVEAVINVSLSIILVLFLDITGVLLATVLALPIKVVYCNYVAEKKVMKRPPLKTIVIFMVNYLIFGSALLINYYIDLQINSYWDFVLYGFAFSATYLIISFGLNILVNKDLFHLVKKILKRKYAVSS